MKKIISLVIAVTASIIVSACGGGGGDSGSDPTPTPPGIMSSAPLPVYGTSYENKNEIVLDYPKLPFRLDIVDATPDAGEFTIINHRAIAFADFFQDGSLTVLTTVQAFNNLYPKDNPGQWADSPTKLYFLKKYDDGKWHDVTMQLIKKYSDRFICINAGFAEIADYNNDKKPDVIFGCNGPDFTINGVWDDTSEQYVVLSQPDGSYKVNKLGIGKIYAHQMAAADINGDGNVDLISTDPKIHKKPIVLWGNGDGTFKVDAAVFPSDMMYKNIYGIQAIPVNGKIYVIASGETPGKSGNVESTDYGTKILEYSNGKFNYVDDLTSYIPTVTATGNKYDFALDVIYKNGSLYMLLVDVTYDSHVYVKIPYSFTNQTSSVAGVSQYATKSYSILKEINRANWSFDDTSGMMKITTQNYLVSQTANCNEYVVSPSDYFYTQCNIAIPL
jgi:hypothetical protein